MPALESIVQNFTESHEEFRLILTSMPVNYFPISILENSLKMTTDNPKGIKSILKKTFSDIITQKTLDSLQESPVIQQAREQDSQTSFTQENYQKQKSWRTILFGLAFCHAIVQERKKFGPNGWNTPYDFSDADLATSVTMIQNFMSENDQIPWDSITFMTGQINYGGRVTDDADRTLLMVILGIYMNDALVLSDNYKFSSSGLYYCPENVDGELLTVADIQVYISQLPDQDQPEVFGMHQNAYLQFLRSQSSQIITQIVDVQPRIVTSTSGDVKSSDDQVLDIAGLIKIPEPIAPLVSKSTKNTAPTNSLLIFLHQEIQRYNTLLLELQRSLDLLVKAVKGEILMDTQLDQMYTSLLTNRLPQTWQQQAYPSIKPLASWVLDLNARISFIHDWQHKTPTAYWLSGLFYTHGFLTAVLQSHARKHRVPIDQLEFGFQVKPYLSEQKDVTSQVKAGVLVYGLYLENAKWSRKYNQLADCVPGQVQSVMPIIHFLPQVKKQEEITLGDIDASKTVELEKASGYYECPVYKTQLRAGTLSTTGQSTNFLLYLRLKCNDPSAGDYSTFNESNYFTNSQQPASSHHDSSSSEHLSEDSAQITTGLIQKGSAQYWTLQGAALLTMIED